MTEVIQRYIFYIAVHIMVARAGEKMSVFIQVFFTYLLLSCDNVVIIASATKNLHSKQSGVLKLLGISLAPFLVLLFIWLASFLLNISWMHIRILGGIVLLYVNYNVLRHMDNKKDKNFRSEGLTVAVLSIIAADLTLSLESSISILSIAAKSGGTSSISELTQIVIALFVSLPILLFFGKAVSKLLDKYTIITYLCAGYLVFMAMQMIFEDESIKVFFQAMYFTLTTFTAVLSGTLVIAASIFMQSKNLLGSPVRKKGLIILGFITAVYSLFTIIKMTYLSTNPIIDGIVIDAEHFLGFPPFGANAIYTLSVPPHLFTIFMLFLSGIFYGYSTSERTSFSHYIRRFKQAVLCMLLLIIFHVLLCTVGLTNTLGFGTFNPWSLVNLLLQIFVLVIYMSIFFFIRSMSKIKAAGTFACLMFILLESMLIEIFWHIKPLQIFVFFLPDFYLHVLQYQITNPLLPVQLLLVGFTTIPGTLWAAGFFSSRPKSKA